MPPKKKKEWMKKHSWICKKSRQLVKWCVCSAFLLETKDSRSCMESSTHRDSSKRRSEKMAPTRLSDPPLKCHICLQISPSTDQSREKQLEIDHSSTSNKQKATCSASIQLDVQQRFLCDFQIMKHGYSETKLVWVSDRFQIPIRSQYALIWIG